MLHRPSSNGARKARIIVLSEAERHARRSASMLFAPHCAGGGRCDVSFFIVMLLVSSREILEEIAPQYYGYAQQHFGVDAVALKHAVDGRTVAVEFVRQPTYAALLPLQFLPYRLPEGMFGSLHLSLRCIRLRDTAI